MNKRAQALEFPLTGLMKAVVVFAVLTVAASAFAILLPKYCETQQFTFQTALVQSVNEYVRAGGERSSGLISRSFPCRANKLIVADANKRRVIDRLGFLEDEPIVRDAVLETDKNGFLLGGPSLKSSFELPNVRLPYPHVLCVEKSGSFSYEVHNPGNLGGNVTLYPGCDANRCNFIPEKLSDVEIDMLAHNTCCHVEPLPPVGSCPGDLGYDDCAAAEHQTIENADGNLDVMLSVSSCSGDTTQVTFEIRPREGVAGKEVKIIENVPKRCIEDLREVLQKVEGGDADILVKADPAIVWNFGTLSATEQTGYEIAAYLDDFCRAQLRATASAELIVKASSADTPIDAMTGDDLADGFELKDADGNVIPIGANERVVTKTNRARHPARLYPENPTGVFDVYVSDFAAVELGDDLPELTGLAAHETGVDLSGNSDVAELRDADWFDRFEIDRTRPYGFENDCRLDASFDQLVCENLPDREVTVVIVAVDGDGKRRRRFQVELAGGGGAAPVGGTLALNLDGLEDSFQPRDIDSDLFTIFQGFGVNREAILNGVVIGSDWRALRRIDYSAPDGIWCETPVTAGTFDHDIQCRIPDDDNLKGTTVTISLAIENTDGETASDDFRLEIRN